MSKKSCLFLIMFLTIGFATISSTLIIRGSAKIGVNNSDFNVYFSDAIVNGEQDLSVIYDDTEIYFDAIFKSKNDSYVLEYEVTNGSRNYDADLNMNCVGANDYLVVTNVFDTTNVLEATKSRSGTLTVVLDKQYTGELLEVELVCTLDASGVERTSYAEIPNFYMVGNEVRIEEHSFRVIDSDDTTVTLLSDDILGPGFIQSDPTAGDKSPSLSDAPLINYDADIDLSLTDGDVTTYLDDYMIELQTLTDDYDLTTNLITLLQLRELGCEGIEDNYEDIENVSCDNSEYASWLILDDPWWTRSKYGPYSIWVVSSGDLGSYLSEDYVNIRPIVILNKETFDKYYDN